MGDIKVSAQAGQIQFSLSENERSAQFSIPTDDAEALALQILDLVAKQRGPQTQSLWEQMPMVSARNPRWEVTKRDDGTVLLAIGLGDWRPIYLILDQARIVDVGSLPPA